MVPDTRVGALAKGAMAKGAMALIGRPAALKVGKRSHPPPPPTSQRSWCPALRHCSTRTGFGSESSRELLRASFSPRLTISSQHLRFLRISPATPTTCTVTTSTLRRATTSAYYPSSSSSLTTPTVTTTTTSAARARPQPPPHSPRSAQIRTMSDDAYAAFLGKANKDYSGGRRGSVSGMKSAEIGEQHEPHPAIESLGERFYTSDADEPFVSVQLEGKGPGLPDAGEFFFCLGLLSLSRCDPV